MISKIELYLKEKWEKQLWQILWVLFVGSVALVFNFYYDALPSYLATIKQYESDKQQYNLEVGIVNNINKQIVDIKDKNTRLLIAFLKAIDASEKGQKVDVTQVQSLVSETAEVQTKISSVRNNIKAIAFTVKPFIDFFQGYEELLNNIDKILIQTQSFCTTYQTNERELRKVTKEIRISLKNLNVEELIVSFEQRTKNIQQFLTNEVSAHAVIESQQATKLGFMNWHILGILFCILYVVIFAIFAVSDYIHFGGGSGTNNSRNARGILARITLFSANTLKNVEVFFDNVGNKKLWLGTACLFSMSCWFSISQISKTIDFVVVSDELEIERTLYDQETLQFQSINESFSSVNQTFIIISKSFISMFGDVNSLDNGTHAIHLEVKNSLECYKSITELRNKIPALLGTIKGIKTKIPQYAECYGFMTDTLVNYEKIATKYEETIISIALAVKASKDHKLIKSVAIDKALKNLDIKGTLISTSELASKSQIMAQRMRLFVQTTLNSFEQREAALERTASLFIFVIILAIAQISFLIISIKSFVKYIRRPQESNCSV